jgi:serine/threonine protein kinase
MRLHEVIDDADENKLHIVMEYCPNGELLSFSDETGRFMPPSFLLETEKTK